jgi:hypothetical protein
MDKYLIIKKTGKGSDHNEKVNGNKNSYQSSSFGLTLAMALSIKLF